MAKNILLIEDDKLLSRSLVDALAKNYQVIVADNGTDALDLAAKEPIDAIVLDIGLPDISGITVLNQLKSQPKTSKVPILVLTNMSDAQTVSDIIAAGGKEYLVKADWSLDDIVNKIDSLI